MSENVRLSLPMRGPEEVRPHLGKQYHWKPGHSAQAVAYSWFKAGSIPARVATVLDQVAWFKGATLVDAFLERKTDLRDGCGAASQTDLLAIVTADGGRDLAIVAVEAKVREPFGKLVSEWLDGSARKEVRLTRLCELFRISREDALPLRYQLLHRAAAAIYEAERYRRDVAAFVVQSFCPDATGMTDFVAFANALGFTGAGRDQMTDGRKFGSVVLLLGWAADTMPQGAAAC